MDRIIFAFTPALYSPPPSPIVKQSSDMATKFLPPIFMLQGQTVSGFSVALKGTCCCPLLL